MYIDDCILGTKKIFNSNCNEVLNLGSSEQVSINQLIDLIEDIAEYSVEKNYLLNKPKGVRGRSSDNTKIKKILNWSPSINLKSGLQKTYNWIESDILSGSNLKKFTKVY